MSLWAPSVFRNSSTSARSPDMWSLISAWTTSSFPMTATVLGASSPGVERGPRRNSSSTSSTFVRILTMFVLVVAERPCRTSMPRWMSSNTGLTAPSPIAGCAAGLPDDGRGGTTNGRYPDILKCCISLSSSRSSIEYLDAGESITSGLREPAILLFLSSLPRLIGGGVILGGSAASPPVAEARGDSASGPRYEFSIDVATLVLALPSRLIDGRSSPASCRRRAVGDMGLCGRVSICARRCLTTERSSRLRMDGLGARDGLSVRGGARKDRRALCGVVGGAGSGESVDADNERLRRSRRGKVGGLDPSVGTGGRSRSRSAVDMYEGVDGEDESLMSDPLERGSAVDVMFGTGDSIGGEGYMPSETAGEYTSTLR